MIVTRITDNNRSRLLLIFAGWGMDGGPFAHLIRDDYDLWVAHSYDSPGHINGLDNKQEICVVAWSFGVIEAARFIQSNAHRPITLRVAINGTLHPVDDQHGIPGDIFNGTLNSLSDRTLYKFYRRMCGDADTFAQFMSTKPQRTLDSLADELRHIASLPHINNGNPLWDTIYVSSRDAIIPPANQLNAWAGHHDIRTIDCSHLPPFKSIIDRHITHKPTVAQRFSQSANSYNENATVQKQTAETLANLWASKQSADKAKQILEIGPGTGLFTKQYLQLFTPTNLTMWDISTIDDTLPGIHSTCDAEAAICLTEPASYDAIVSSSAIQWFNSPASFVARAFAALRPGGVLAFSAYGTENFREISNHIQSSAHLMSAAQWEALIPAEASGAQIIEDFHTLTFDTPRQLLRHITLTGVNISNSPTKVQSAKQILKSGITTLTYHPIYILIQK